MVKFYGEQLPERPKIV